MFKFNYFPEECPEAEETEYRRGPEGFGPRFGRGPFGRPPMGPRPLPFDPDSLEGMVIGTARMIRHSGRERFGSTQDRIIRVLDENGGTMGQKSLQELLRVRPGSISEILAKMEEKGLISRSRDEGDRRAALITLNAEVHPETERQNIFAVLTEEEQADLKELLKKVLASKKPE
ncbi:MAG: MarR family transcriptional regulator [Solobacterium sp.]|nr:MarR family transcriptional regulator [Solobacterium sp.]